MWENRHSAQSMAHLVQPMCAAPADVAPAVLGVEQPRSNRWSYGNKGLKLWWRESE